MPYTLFGLLIFAIVAYVLIGMVEDAKAQKLFKIVAFLIILFGLLAIFVPGLGFDFPRLK